MQSDETISTYLVRVEHMMKLLATILMVLFLSSCNIDVDDFGVYANKTFMDSQLEGSWRRIALTPEDSREGMQKLKFVANRDRYDVWIEPSNKTDKQPTNIKLLGLGSYHFIILGDPLFKKTVTPNVGSPQICRYDISGHILKIYLLNVNKMEDFITSHYPQHNNIEVSHSWGDKVEIKLLDDETVKILSNIPDNEDFWRLYIEYKRLSNSTIETPENNIDTVKASSNSTSPAEVVLKNGQKLEGEIVEQTNKYIKIDTGIGIPLTYYMDEIDTINGQKTSGSQSNPS